MKDGGYILLSVNNIIYINNIKAIINKKFSSNSNEVLRYFHIDEIYTLLENKLTIDDMFYRYYLEEDCNKELIDILTKYGKFDRINYNIDKYYIKAKLNI